MYIRPFCLMSETTTENIHLDIYIGKQLLMYIVLIIFYEIQLMSRSIFLTKNYIILQLWQYQNNTSNFHFCSHNLLRAGHKNCFTTSNFVPMPLMPIAKASSYIIYLACGNIQHKQHVSFYTLSFKVHQPRDCSCCTVYLAWLQFSTRKQQQFQYLKLIFLKIPNVTTQLIFPNQMTYTCS